MYYSQLNNNSNGCEPLIRNPEATKKAEQYFLSAERKQWQNQISASREKILNESKDILR